ncbi:hypothetical protein [Oceanisphaera ostreae]|uniref:Uncharacterized protein n=1 Tax=Oceanisphaera ostreae TaxID=914151 RepID=A0ABW3KJN6_9GAMM
MATLLHTRQSLCSAMSWQPLLLDAPFMYTPNSTSTDATKCNISHWGGVPQARLLANLAAISQNNSGWILIANAPAPLSRQALLEAGIDLARVIDAKQASRQLVLRATACPSIAVVVCWKYGDLKQGPLDINHRPRHILAARRCGLSTRAAVSYKRLDAHKLGKERCVL